MLEQFVDRHIGPSEEEMRQMLQFPRAAMVPLQQQNMTFTSMVYPHTQAVLRRRAKMLC